MILNVETSKLVDCYFREIDGKEIKEKKYNPQGGWAFDWMDDLIAGYRVFGLETKEYPNVVQGLVSVKALRHPDYMYVHLEHVESAKENLKLVLKTKEPNLSRRYESIGTSLIAFACQYSIDEGLDGYVALVSKTATVPFYEQIGAVQFGQRLIFDEYAGQSLAKKYFPGGVQWLD